MKVLNIKKMMKLVAAFMLPVFLFTVQSQSAFARKGNKIYGTTKVNGKKVSCSAKKGSSVVKCRLSGGKGSYSFRARKGYKKAKKKYTVIVTSARVRKASLSANGSITIRTRKRGKVKSKRSTLRVRLK